MILEALNVHITTIDLSEEAAVLSLGELMKKEEYLSRLIGVLTRLHRDCHPSNWSPGDIVETDYEFSIILDEKLPIEVTAVVYEIQIHTVLNLSRGQHATARSLCHKAMEAYSETNCVLRQARVIERLLYLAVLDGDNAEDLLTLGLGTVSILTSTKVFLG